MLNIKRGTISLQKEKEEESIMEWTVWFRTPFGVHADLEAAIQRCEESDLDPEIFVKPVPVAIAASGIYEIINT